MYDDEYIKELICKCGHSGEFHLWELREVGQDLIVKPINFNSENFVHGYAIARCWSDVDQKGRRCQCEILDFIKLNDWNNLAERMRTRIDKTVMYRIKRIGIEP
jgi:hypothetical protein